FTEKDEQIQKLSKENRELHQQIEQIQQETERKINQLKQEFDEKHQAHAETQNEFVQRAENLQA
ncbi:unnamed protein product, partial [Rotaria magnacalcarata]